MGSQTSPKTAHCSEQWSGQVLTPGSTQGLNLNESQLVRLEMELLSKGLLKEKPKKATSRKVELIEEEPRADDEIKEEPCAEDKIRGECCADDEIQEDPDADQDITELLQSDNATPEDILNQTQGIFASQHFMDPIHRDSDPFNQSIFEMNSENVAANMKISKEEDIIARENTKKEAEDLSARIGSCQVAYSSSDEVFDSDDKWDSEDEDGEIWNQPVQKRDSDDLEQILEDLDDKKEECESTDPERMSVDTAEEKVLEEPRPSSLPRNRKHLKIKEDKQKRAAFLESSVIIIIKMDRYLIFITLSLTSLTIQMLVISLETLKIYSEGLQLLTPTGTRAHLAKMILT